MAGSDSTGDTSPVSGTIRRNVVMGGRNIGSGPIAWGIALGQRADGIHIYDNIIAHNRLGTGGELGILTTYGTLNIAPGSQAIVNCDIYDNIVYDWGYHGGESFYISSTPDAASGVSVHDNVFAEFNSTSSLVVQTADPIPGWSFSNNIYSTTRTASQWFQVGGTYYSLSGWTSAFDAGASSTVPSYSDPNRTIESYMTLLGQTATVDAFISRCLLQCRDNWDANFAARTVINYVRVGFDLATV